LGIPFFGEVMIIVGFKNAFTTLTNLKQFKMEINVITGSSTTTFTHKKINNVINITVNCSNIDEYAYNFKIIKRNDLLRTVFEGFKETFTEKQI